MTDQQDLAAFSSILEDPETAEAYLFDGKLYVKREYRDPRELQTRSTYHGMEPDDKFSEDNMVMMGVFARSRKNGEKVK